MVFEFACDCINDNSNYLPLESTSCRPYQFQCENKKCIWKSDVCNFMDDCGDNSDETLCGMFD